jgi:hypothetical protein
LKKKNRSIIENWIMKIQINIKKFKTKIKISLRKTIATLIYQILQTLLMNTQKKTKIFYKIYKNRKFSNKWLTSLCPNKYNSLSKNLNSNNK